MWCAALRGRIANQGQIPGPHGSAADVSGMSTTGVMLGTPHYIAPEIWEGKPATPKTDIYSLACVAYEMLAGRHPYSRMPANEARAHGIEVMPIVGLTARQNAALRSALEMPAEERRKRMRRMRRRLKNNTIFDWLESILARGADIMSQQQPVAR